MMNTRIITRQDDLVPAAAWDNPIALDADLFAQGWYRSDAGFRPGTHCHVQPIGEMSNNVLEQICAALAVQRAILCIFTCDQRQPDTEKVGIALGQIQPVNAQHKAMLASEVEMAIDGRCDAAPPQEVHSYRAGLVSNMIGNTLKIIGNVSLEQIGVVADLSGDTSIIEQVSMTSAPEGILGQGAQDVSAKLPVRLRNALAWHQRNPGAGEDRLGRYLTAYGLTVDGLMMALETPAAEE